MPLATPPGSKKPHLSVAADPGLGASPFRACLALPPKPGELGQMVDFVKHCISRQACTPDYTDINPDLGLKSQARGRRWWLH